MLDSGFAHVDWSDGSSRESRTLGIIAGFAAHEQEQRLTVCPAKATSMLVYRGPSSSSLNRTLFLAPDGAGYATIFNNMGQLLGQESLSLSVYALNNPFTTTTPALCSEHHMSSVEAMAAIYTAEIKRLVLLDSPCPTSPVRMSDALVRYIYTISSPGDISLARDQLQSYRSQKLPGVKMLPTILVSARMESIPGMLISKTEVLMLSPSCAGLRTGF